MINVRYLHGAISMGNKMFVISRNHDKTCEVIDSLSRKFNNIKQRIMFNDRHKHFTKIIVQPVSIGKKIIVLPRFYNPKNKKYLTYDVLTDKWKLEENKLFSTDYIFSCSRVPFV